MAVTKLPSNEKKTNHSAHVLTSSENLQFIREKEMKKHTNQKLKILESNKKRRQQNKNKNRKEVEERKEQVKSQERQKKEKNKMNRVHQNLILQEKSTVSFLGGMRMVMIYLT